MRMIVLVRHPTSKNPPAGWLLVITLTLKSVMGCELEVDKVFEIELRGNISESKVMRLEAVEYPLLGATTKQ
jgi:hypothetical protein